MNEENSLSYNSIRLTISELNKVENNLLVEKLKKILLTCELPKTEKHNRKDDMTTSFFKVLLDENEIELLVDLFLDLEVSSLDDKYESTPITSLYSDMVALWSGIIPKSKS